MKNFSSCDSMRKESNENVIKEQSAAGERIYTKIHNVIGHRKDAIKRLGKSDYIKYYQPMEQALYNHFSDSYYLLRENFNLSEYMSALRDHIQQITGHFFDQQHGFSTSVVIRNARTARLISTTVMKNINEQRKNWDKQHTPPLWRLLMPPQNFARKIDPFGMISTLFEAGRRLLEKTRFNTQKYKEDINESKKQYLNTIESITDLKFLDKDHFMDGIKIRVYNGGKFIENVSKQVWGMSNLRESTEYTIVDAKRDENGKVTYKGNISVSVEGLNELPENHKILNEIIQGQKVIGYKVQVDLTEKDIARDEIKNAVAEKYAAELINKLGSGQTRYIEWHDIKEHQGKSMFAKDDNYNLEVRKINDILRRNAVKTEGKYSSSEIHEIRKGRKIYKYVMLKEPEGQGKREVYKAFIVGHADLDGKNKKFYYRPTKQKGSIRIDARAFKKGELVNATEIGLKDEFVTSETEREFGPHVIWDAKEKQYALGETAEKTFADFKRMPIQPHEDLLGNNKPEDEAKRNFLNIWEMLSKHRTVLKEAAKNLQERVKKNQATLNKYFRRDANGNSLLEKTLRESVKENGQEIYNELVKMMQINSNVWLGKDGSIQTPNSSFSAIKTNYWPVFYEEGVVIQQLKKAINGLENTISKFKPDEISEEKEDAIKQLSIFKAVLDKKMGLIDYEQRAKATIAERTAHLKHRAKWTDKTQRRMDASVLEEYLDSTFNSVSQNGFLNSTFDTVYRLAASSGKNNMPKEYLSSIINRVKMDISDPTAEIDVAGFHWLGNGRFKQFVNKIPGFENISIEQVGKMNRFIKGLFTGGLLRMGAALTNRTQTINNVIDVGYAETKLALKALKEEKWQTMIDKSGINEITAYFEAFLTGGGGETTIQDDAGSIIFPLLHVPMPLRAFTDFIFMAKSNRTKALENVPSAVDVLLRKSEDQRLNRQVELRLKKRKAYELLKKKNLSVSERIQARKSRKFLQRIEREEARSNDPIKKRTIEELRSNFLDMVLTPKESRDRKTMEAHVKKIHGKLAEERMQRMVEWTLGWWPDETSKSLFTFTEGEKLMRQVAAVSTLQHYERHGLLPESNKNGSHLWSNDAIRIARNAVSNTMFGMNLPNIGEGFAGVAGVLGIFKSYAIQQTIFDFQVVSSYINSGNTLENLTTRMVKAINGARKSKDGKISFDPNDESVDHEAIRMFRWFTGRIAITTFYSAIRAFGISKRVENLTPSRINIPSFARGFESPLLGLPLRIAIRALATSMLDKDDDEENYFEFGEEISRLFLPVVISYLIFLGKLGYDSRNKLEELF